MTKKPDFIPEDLHDSLLQCYMNGLIKSYVPSSDQITVWFANETLAEKREQFVACLINRYNIEERKINLTFDRVEVRR